MNKVAPYRIFPVGDTALSIDFGNVIDEHINKQVLQLFALLRKDPLTGMIEAVPAYSSLTVYYDVIAARNNDNTKTAYEAIKLLLEERLASCTETSEEDSRLVSIPVCYDVSFSSGTKELASTKNIAVDEIIQLHTGKQYRVYMLGFLPGFAYMGEVDDRIAMPRKTKPEMVPAGSVGIAGKQTGIYPLQSPGGWCIIGRTPLKLFDAAKEDNSLLQAGDRVQFISISKDEFESYQGGHT